MYRHLGDGDRIDPLKEMVAAHWKYVEGVLIAHGVTGRELSSGGHHYRTAFHHGYKHALEGDGLRRGEKEAHTFAGAITDVINLPKNTAKGGWDDVPVGELIHLLTKEVQELYIAVHLKQGDPLSEVADVGAFAMMIHDRLAKS